MNERFRKFANAAAALLGTPTAFYVGILTIIVWATTGPMFRYSDTWQLVINTGTSVVTFLMVFLIQTTQNRDTRALHLKLDELLRALGAARTKLVHLEDLSDEDLDALEEEFKKLHKKMRRRPPFNDEEPVL